jgi:hypothetical protein
LITFCDSSKGNQRPFCKLQAGIRLPHALFFLFAQNFFILHAVAIPFATCKKEFDIFYGRAESKGGK